MKEIRVLKSYQLMTQDLRTPAELDMQTDRAVAEFRAFYVLGAEHIERLNTTLSMNVVEEVLSELLKVLEKKREIV